MKLDFDAMKEAAEKHNKEDMEAFNQFLNEEKAHDEKAAAEMNSLLMKFAEQMKKERIEEAERKIMEETKEAEKQIRAKYLPKSMEGATTEKGFREMLNALNQE